MVRGSSAAAVAAEGRLPMRTVAEVIGVSRSNLADRLQERCKKRIGRPPLPDEELVSKIKAVIAELAGTSDAMTAALRGMNVIGVGAPTALRSAATTASGSGLRLHSTAVIGKP